MSENKAVTEHEQGMLEMGCPECGGDIELYDTNAEGTRGKYRCKECPRDTVWSVVRAQSIHDILAHHRQLKKGN